MIPPTWYPARALPAAASDAEGRRGQQQLPWLTMACEGAPVDHQITIRGDYLCGVCEEPIDGPAIVRIWPDGLREVSHPGICQGWGRVR